MSDLLLNVHEGLTPPPGWNTQNTICTRGHYLYFHYNCDGYDDRGWGCGYRTLQTLCSWIRVQLQAININDEVSAKFLNSVPSIGDIQSALVEMGDKQPRFLGSRDWIGTYETCLILDHMFNVSCKLIHVKSGQDLRAQLPEIKQHFMSYGCPLMMGGDTDTSSKAILGVCEAKNIAYLLILDPHFCGKHRNRDYIQRNGYIKWVKLSEFLDSSFYNICMPLVQFKS